MDKDWNRAFRKVESVDSYYARSRHGLHTTLRAIARAEFSAGERTRITAQVVGLEKLVGPSWTYPSSRWLGPDYLRPRRRTRISRPGRLETDFQQSTNDMNDVEWLHCSDPSAMIDTLRNAATDRSLRRFMTAVCRRIWHLLSDNGSRQAVEASEALLEGAGSRIEEAILRAAWEAMRDAERHLHGTPAGSVRDAAEATHYAAAAAFRAAVGDGFNGADTCSHFAARAIANYRDNADGYAIERSRQCDVLRCIFPNPFRTIVFDSIWLSWHDGAVPRLAQAAYDHRNFPDCTIDNARTAILADALEEAGCSDTEILLHLRNPGPHVHGCWVLNRILGKDDPFQRTFEQRLGAVARY